MQGMRASAIIAQVMSRLKRVRRVWRWVLSVGPRLLLAALLPSLLFIDHWDEYLDYALGQEPFVAAEHASHQVHCHGGPASCSQQPAPTNVQVFASVVQVPQPALMSFAFEDAAMSPDEHLMSPPTDPPRL